MALQGQGPSLLPSAAVSVLRCLSLPPTEGSWPCWAHRGLRGSSQGPSNTTLGLGLQCHRLASQPSLQLSIN